MGAHSIVRHVATDKDLHEAWESMWREERLEHGSDAYSGTFATCSGVEQVADAMGVGEAEQVATAFFREDRIPAAVSAKMHRHIAAADGSILHKPEKWGKAFAIPVYDNAETKVKAGKVTVSHDKSGYLHQDDLLALVGQRVSVPSGSWLANLRVEEDTVRPAHAVQRAAGKSTTVWVIVGDRGSVVPGTAEYATEREAITAAKLHIAGQLQAGWMQSGGKVTVRGIRKRDGGETTVSGSVAARKTKIAYEIHTPRTSKRGGWYFLAWAAS